MSEKPTTTEQLTTNEKPTISYKSALPDKYIKPNGNLSSEKSLGEVHSMKSQDAISAGATDHLSEPSSYVGSSESASCMGQVKHAQSGRQISVEEPIVSSVRNNTVSVEKPTKSEKPVNVCGQILVEKPE
eukprot:557468_1